VHCVLNHGSVGGEQDNADLGKWGRIWTYQNTNNWKKIWSNDNVQLQPGTKIEFDIFVQGSRKMAISFANAGSNYEYLAFENITSPTWLSTTSNFVDGEWEKQFDGECGEGQEIRMFEGAENPGETNETRIKECASACRTRKITLSGSWKHFAALGPVLGYVFKPDPSRCYCENSNSATCSRTGADSGWQRYDFVKTTPATKSLLARIASTNKGYIVKEAGTAEWNGYYAPCIQCQQAPHHYIKDDNHELYYNENLNQWTFADYGVKAFYACPQSTATSAPSPDACTFSVYENNAADPAPQVQPFQPMKLFAIRAFINGEFILY